MCHATYLRNQDREKFRAYRRQQVTCECGTSCRRDSLTEHQSTKRHLNILAKKVQPSKVIIKNKLIKNDLLTKIKPNTEPDSLKGCSAVPLLE